MYFWHQFGKYFCAVCGSDLMESDMVMQVTLILSLKEIMYPTMKKWMRREWRSPFKKFGIVELINEIEAFGYEEEEGESVENSEC